jgi:hypothetical protein
MAAYTIRVELKGDPSFAQYEKLHTLMAGMGFDRTISGTTPMGLAQVFDLPHATYYGQSILPVGNLRDSVQANIQDKIQSQIAIFVALTETWAIYAS